MNAGTAMSAGGAGSVGPLGGAGAAGGCGAAFAAGAAGLAAAGGAAGFAAGGLAAAVGCPVAELVSLVVAVVAAAGFAGFGAGGSVLGAPTGAAETPAPGASVRDTSAFNGSPDASLAGLSPAAFAGVGGVPASAPRAVVGGVGGSGLLGSSAIYTQSSAPFCHA
jgi:hypothetical protein